jgi:hypothetical protein
MASRPNATREETPRLLPVAPLPISLGSEWGLAAGGPLN